MGLVNMFGSSYSSPAQHQRSIMAETTPSSGLNQTDTTTTIVIAVVLISVVLLLVITIAVVALLLAYRRRMLCFRRRLDQSKLLQSDLERYGPMKRHGRRKKFDRKKPKRRKHKRKGKYQSYGKAPRFPKSDPFTNKFLENPLIADDEFDMDWTNPAFDSEGARVYDATIIIQSWYRMIRYDNLHVYNQVIYNPVGSLCPVVTSLYIIATWQTSYHHVYGNTTIIHA